MKTAAGCILILCSLTVHSQAILNVYFGFNKHDITAATKKQLDSLLQAEKNNLAGCIMQLDGYCDPVGANEYNDRLSEKRVSAIKKYLLQKGIAPGSIAMTKGHGEKDQLNENRTAVERQLNRRVEITFNKAGQSSLSASKENLSLTEKIADSATKAGTHVVLKNINFFGGSPFLLPESFPVLDELIEVMRVNRSLVIEIQGHICCIATPGDSPYGGTGNGLSEERAKMIYAELIGKGIEPNRVSYKGYGHSMPIYPFPEKNEEERITNRRVEIKIISK